MSGGALLLDNFFVMSSTPLSYLSQYQCPTRPFTVNMSLSRRNSSLVASDSACSTAEDHALDQRLAQLENEMAAAEAMRAAIERVLIALMTRVEEGT